MTTATHAGTCQICGREQKLPGERLSIHGYSKQFGFFMGTCGGSHHLPFEVSCDLIQARVDQARAHAALLRQEEAELRKQATESTAWYSEYIPATWEHRKSRNVWTQVRLVEELYEGRFVGATFVDSTGKTHRTVQMCLAGGSLLELATKMNASRADSLARSAQEIEGYIRWQEKRLASWKPGTLRPLGAAPAEAA